MEKQFDLIQTNDGWMILESDKKTQVAYCFNNNNIGLPKFKLSDIGIDDVDQMIDEEYEKNGKQYSSIGKPAFKNGFLFSKEKYKYTEEDMRRCWINAIDKKEIFFDDYINSLNKLPTKVWLEMEEKDVFSNGIKIGFEWNVKVDENNYVKILRYG